MAQISLRISDDLANDLREEARSRKLSLNGYLTFVVTTAVNPEMAGSQADQLRERFRRAGLLAEWTAPAGERPSRDEVKRARDQASQGTPLSELVSEGRG